MVRLQKYMADCGVGSRRKCEEYIKSGRVSVDGNIVTEMGVKIVPSSSFVLFDGKRILPEEKNVYVALNKPKGFITSSDDQFNRPTVLDLVSDIDARLFSVGRLDYNSQGLIFLTNDGDFAYRLTHPKHHIEKKYYVKVSGKPSEESINLLKNGVYLDDKKTFPADVSFLRTEAGLSELYITISEGRNRQVRRMFDEIGHPVIELIRVQVGNVCLGDLEEGKYRYLTEDEIKELIE